MNMKEQDSQDLTIGKTEINRDGYKEKKDDS